MVYLEGFTGTQANLLNGKTHIITSVDTTNNKITIVNPMASDGATALYSLGSGVVYHILDANFTVSNGSFMIGENLEDDDIYNSGDSRMVSLEDRGALYLLAQYDSPTEAKRISHILLMSKVMVIKQGQVSVY